MNHPDTTPFKSVRKIESPTAMNEPSPEGLLVVDKPIGLTSFDVIRTLRRSLDTRAVGHTGTLDPRASGVLCVGVGWALKLIRFLDHDQKVYRADVRLGEVSNTDDSEGQITVRKPPQVTSREIEIAAESFVGPIMQRPPAYSALKRNGERAYERARRGEVVELEPRPVQIDAIEVEAIELPDIRLRVTCGPGTYIRSLARDLGDSLGCGGYLLGLRRLANGGFDIDQAMTLDDLLAEIGSGNPPFISPRQMLFHLPTIELPPLALTRLSQGQRLLMPPSLSASTGSAVAVCGDSGDRSLWAVAIVEEQPNGERRLKPQRVRPRKK